MGGAGQKQADWPGASIGQTASESKENVMAFAGHTPKEISLIGGLA
jgi:hypothetical protein